MENATCNHCGEKILDAPHYHNDGVHKGTYHVKCAIKLGLITHWREL